MKIIVFSDSHGTSDAMLAAVHREKPDAIIHCGDYAKDIEAVRRRNKTIPAYCVCGNCDYTGGYEEEIEFVLENKKFFVTHGHRYGVKRGYQNLSYAGAEREADIVICGHTHIPIFEEYEGMCLLNPGSVTFGKKTYGIIEIEEGSLKCSIKNI